VQRSSTKNMTSADLIDGDDYDGLPDGIKLSLSRIEYMWLSDHEKATLVQTECEPDWNE
jgi:hypothetical protein